MKAILLTLAIITLPVSISAQNDYRIQKALDNYDYSKAIEIIDSALSLHSYTAALTQAIELKVEEEQEAVAPDPHYIWLKLQKSRCQKKLLRYSEACATLEEIADWDNPQIMGELADSYSAASQYDNAIGIYTRLAELHPDNVFFPIQAASLYYKTEDYKSAYLFCKSIEKQEENQVIYNLMGNCLANVNQIDSAIFYYNKALEINPLRAGTVSSTANLLLQKKDYPAVIELTENFLQKKPDEHHIKSILGLACFLSGKNKKAYDCFHELWEENERSYSNSYYLGLSAFYEKDYLLSIKAYENAWQQDSTQSNLAISYGDAASHLGIIHKHNPNFYYDHAIKLEQADSTIMAKALTGKGNNMLRENNISEALQFFLQAHDYQPQTALTSSFIGYCYRRLKDYKKAKTWYERYLSLSNNPGSKNHTAVIEELKFINSELFMEE